MFNQKKSNKRITRSFFKSKVEVNKFSQGKLAFIDFEFLQNIYLPKIFTYKKNTHKIQSNISKNKFTSYFTFSDN